MRHFSVAFASIPAFLLGIVFAAPMPQHIPGDIVRIPPKDTTGPAFGSGSIIPHPNIVLGHGANGMVSLATVSHTTNEKFRPYMPVGELHHSLSGNIHLGHVEAPLAHLPPPAINPVNVGQAGLQKIHDAKANVAEQVAAHHAASHAHHGAAAAHAEAKEGHLQVAAAHTKHAEMFHHQHPQAARHHDAAQEHHAKAAFHGHQAATHTDHARTHTDHANNPTGVSNDAARHAHTSALNAHISNDSAVHSLRHADAGRAHLKAAGAHDSASHSHEEHSKHAHGSDYPFAIAGKRHHAEMAKEHRKAAISHSPNSPNKPHPGTSHQDAEASHHHAHTSKNNVPHVFHRH